MAYTIAEALNFYPRRFIRNVLLSGHVNLIRNLGLNDINLQSFESLRPELIGNAILPLRLFLARDLLVQVPVGINPTTASAINRFDLADVLEINRTNPKLQGDNIPLAALDYIRNMSMMTATNLGFTSHVIAVASRREGRSSFYHTPDSILQAFYRTGTLLDKPAMLRRADALNRLVIDDFNELGDDIDLIFRKLGRIHPQVMSTNASRSIFEVVGSGGSIQSEMMIEASNNRPTMPRMSEAGMSAMLDAMGQPIHRGGRFTTTDPIQVTTSDFTVNEESNSPDTRNKYLKMGYSNSKLSSKLSGCYILYKDEVYRIGDVRGDQLIVSKVENGSYSSNYNDLYFSNEVDVLIPSLGFVNTPYGVYFIERHHVKSSNDRYKVGFCYSHMRIYDMHPQPSTAGLRKSFISKIDRHFLGTEASLIEFLFKRTFFTFDDAVAALLSGSRVGCALSEDVALISDIPNNSILTYVGNKAVGYYNCETKKVNLVAQLMGSFLTQAGVVYE